MIYINFVSYMYAYVGEQYYESNILPIILYFMPLSVCAWKNILHVHKCILYTYTVCV